MFNLEYPNVIFQSQTIPGENNDKTFYENSYYPIITQKFNQLYPMV